jgi:hypothetical protein
MNMGQMMPSKFPSFRSYSKDVQNACIQFLVG